MKAFPDLIIAGSAKSGTTALHMMLDQHPAIYMSMIKETNYFVHAYEATRHFVAHNDHLMYGDQEESDITDTPDKYKKLFEGAEDGRLLGESSPWYMLNNKVPGRINSHAPNAKIIFILRNPADVAFANFVHQVRDRSESINLDQIDRIFDPAHYDKNNAHPFCFHLTLPKYRTHLQPFLEEFSRDSLHFIIYEEFLQYKRKALQELFRFLDITNEVDIEVENRVNISGVPKSAILQNLIQGSIGAKKVLRLFIPKKARRNLRAAIEAANTGDKPVLDDRNRKKLDELYSEDVDYVESVLDRKVPVWREMRLC